MLAQILLALAVQSTAPSPTPTPPPPACNSAAYRALDFWVGEWAVSQTGQPAVMAHSRIDKLHAGCVIREQWMPQKGAGGSSLSAYDAADGRWHQRWIDGSGTTVDFDGGAVGDRMVLTGWWRGLIAPGQDGLVRMTYSRNPDGSVRQLGEQSIDHGLTWQPSFDFTYRRAAATH